jgi:hypothetical protein
MSAGGEIVASADLKPDAYFVTKLLPASSANVIWDVYLAGRWALSPFLAQ